MVAFHGLRPNRGLMVSLFSEYSNRSTDGFKLIAAVYSSRIKAGRCRVRSENLILAAVHGP
jgi:hypothetical protein